MSEAGFSGGKTTYELVNDALAELDDRERFVPTEEVVSWVTENHGRKQLDVVEAIESLEKRGDVYCTDDGYKRTSPDDNGGVRA